MSTKIDDMTSTVYISDNLPFLKSIPTQSVDLVCIDPPFGKQQSFVGRLKPPLSSDERRVERAMLEGWALLTRTARMMPAWNTLTSKGLPRSLMKSGTSAGIHMRDG